MSRRGGLTQPIIKIVHFRAYRFDCYVYKKGETSLICIFCPIKGLALAKNKIQVKIDNLNEYVIVVVLSSHLFINKHIVLLAS